MKQLEQVILHLKLNLPDGTTTATSIVNRFPLGSYIQIGGEIMRIASVHFLVEVEMRLQLFVVHLVLILKLILSILELRKLNHYRLNFVDHQY